VTSEGLGSGSTVADGGESGSGAGNTLRAWLFEVDQEGMSTPMLGYSGRCLEKVIEPGAVLVVSTEGGQDTPQRKHLKLPPSEGMASQPVSVVFDANTRFWTLRNNGSTNSLRVQQYGLGAVPLHPGAYMAMSGQDVAIWIPVGPPLSRVSGKGEAFRLLLLRTKLSWRAGRTKGITYDFAVTANMQEALITYFGQYMSWPPLVAPHVRGETEVLAIAAEAGLNREPDLKKWARNRHEVLTGNDGLFTAADWYPQTGGKQRTLANHLTAFHRLVERRTITLARAERWARKHEVFDFISIDGCLKTAGQ
jgi:hypothetical protein